MSKNDIKTNAETVSEAEQVKAALDNAKDSIKEAIESEKQAGNSASETSDAKKETGKVTEGTSKPNNTMNPVSKQKQLEAKKSEAKSEPKSEAKPNAKAEATAKKTEPKKPEVKKAEPAKSANKAATKPKQIIKKAPPEKKQSGKLGVSLAMLLGLVGTGLGAYSFNELRLLKDNVGDGASYSQKVSAAEAEINTLKTALASSGKEVETLKGQLNALLGQEKMLVAGVKQFDARIAQVEQMQRGLGKAVKADVQKALDSRMTAVKTLLGKVKEIELSQKGLSKNLTEVSAAGQAVSASGVNKQEVGYLLRMANYKIQSEGDVHGATGLLKIAENKLLASNDGVVTPLVESVREKLIQLSGVKVVDEHALLSQLASVSQDIAQLNAKVTQATASSVSDNQSAAEKQGLLDKVTSIVASGVKFTPKDPSKIDISSETVLIEKRLLQADVKTAELAVRSRDKVLLASSIQSIKAGVGKYFAADAVAQRIEQSLNAVLQSELNTVLPDLSGLVSQFENNK